MVAFRSSCLGVGVMLFGNCGSDVQKDTGYNLSRSFWKTISGWHGQSVELFYVHSARDFHTIRTKCQATICANRPK